VTFTRWFRFNVVGLAGMAVQLVALALLTRVCRVPDIPATVLAVEIAILHNFGWHELWTWRGLPSQQRWRRLFRFHVANGLVSIASNALLTWLFQRSMGWPVLIANTAAIGATPC
jgi:putative flippase GtrA